MAAFETVLNQANQSNSGGQTAFATELSYANGNIGENMLAPSNLETNRILLDQLQSMGIKGVVLGIKYPILMPDFPRSSEYLQFYKQIMVMARQHGMKVLVECGAIFAGTPYSPVQVDWSKYTTASFLQGLQDQLVVISREIKPDYLTLANEPETEEALTKLSITPAQWKDFIAATLTKVDRSGGMLAGAGTGTWENPAWIDGIMNLPGLDYIDLHIYDLGKNGALLDQALKWASEARAAGKRVTVSESWFWKASSQQSGALLTDSESAMNRDCYSLWYPLDSRFIGDIMNLAHAADMDFVSFFWMRNFFSYIDYNSTPQNSSTAALNRLINQAAISNIQTGNLSLLGRFVQGKLK